MYNVSFQIISFILIKTSFLDKRNFNSIYFPLFIWMRINTKILTKIHLIRIPTASPLLQTAHLLVFQLSKFMCFELNSKRHISENYIQASLLPRLKH